MNLIFDLDGTLTDPQEGITKSIAYALEKLGRKAPPLEDLLWCIGPPLHDSFFEMFKDKDLAHQGVLHYRERYQEIGMYENKVYDGIHQALNVLQQQGHRLYLATSKLKSIADKIIDHFEFREFFISTYGSEIDGSRGDKGELIAYLLSQENLIADSCVMIGDRKHDAIGASKNGVRSIGVSWGYGSREELLTAGADVILTKPVDLEFCFDDFKKEV